MAEGEVMRFLIMYGKEPRKRLRGYWRWRRLGEWDFMEAKEKHVSRSDI